MKKSIASDNSQIKFDELAIKLESMSFTREKVTSHRNPFYDTSKARESLVKDVNDVTAEKYKNKPRELRALSINVFNLMYSPSITTENYTIRKKRLVGNIGKT